MPEGVKLTLHRCCSLRSSHHSSRSLSLSPLVLFFHSFFFTSPLCRCVSYHPRSFLATLTLDVTFPRVLVSGCMCVRILVCTNVFVELFFTGIRALERVICRPDPESINSTPVVDSHRGNVLDLSTPNNLGNGGTPGSRCTKINAGEWTNKGFSDLCIFSRTIVDKVSTDFFSILLSVASFSHLVVIAATNTGQCKGNFDITELGNETLFDDGNKFNFNWSRIRFYVKLEMI